MSKVYFQDYSDDQTFIKGCVDTETKVGLAEVFIKAERIYIDIPTNKVLKEPYSNRQFAHKFANNAIKKASEKINKGA
jgi:cation transport regulator ChaB